MKIFVEGTPVFRQRTGVGQYTYNLLSALFKIDKRNDYTIFWFLFMGKKFDNKPFPETSRLHYRLIRYFPSKVFNGLMRKLVAPPIDLMLASKADLYLFPNFVRYPLAFPSKSIVVIYDLSYILHGEHAAKRNREYLTRYVPKSIRQSEHIITISENSKREIMDYYHTPEDKITIAYPAIDHAFFYPLPEHEVEDITKKYHLASQYILYTGTLEPRKNIIGILDAYAALDKAVQNQYQLVLAGGKGWLDQEIKKRLAELADLNIVTTGYVPDEDLPALYSGARVFVYPSFYEGFGMPPLEAMACGVPVIVANNSSLPEVVGDAGILVDAHDTAGLAEHITEVLSNDTLRAKMKKLGFEQAKRFTWESSAAKLHEVIERVEVGK